MAYSLDTIQTQKRKNIGAKSYRRYTLNVIKGAMLFLCFPFLLNYLFKVTICGYFCIEQITLQTYEGERVLNINYFALTGLDYLDTPVHRASPCADISCPFRAENIPH
jgi:hypothetical protein